MICKCFLLINLTLSGYSQNDFRNILKEKEICKTEKKCLAIFEKKSTIEYIATCKTKQEIKRCKPQN